MPFAVTLIRAFDLHDTEFFGEQRVYASIGIGMDRRMSGERHGRNPQFDELFEFQGPAQGQNLDVELFSTHMMGPRIIGRGRFPLVEAEMTGSITTAIPLFEDNGKQKGMLEISVQAQPMYGGGGMMQPVVMQQPMGYGDPYAQAALNQEVRREEMYEAGMEQRMLDNEIRREERREERREFDEIRREERREGFW